MFLDEVQCVGTEIGILSCLNAGIGHHRCGVGPEAHKYDVGIICTGKIIVSVPSPVQHVIYTVFIVLHFLCI